jgi:hypothetical protein
VCTADEKRSPRSVRLDSSSWQPLDCMEIRAENCVEKGLALKPWISTRKNKVSQQNDTHEKTVLKHFSACNRSGKWGDGSYRTIGGSLNFVERGLTTSLSWQNRKSAQEGEQWDDGPTNLVAMPTPPRTGWKHKKSHKVYSLTTNNPTQLHTSTTSRYKKP